MKHNREKLQKIIREATFLTDGGMETDLIFNRDTSLPYFASFDLLSTAWGTSLLEAYYREYLELAVQKQCGFIIETPTWRANPDWGPKLGYDARALREMNVTAVNFATALRDRFADRLTAPLLVSGNIGPRGDGYSPANQMSADEARKYHSFQIGVFADSPADFVSAFTINYVDEAVGITLAAKDAGIPVVISFTVETDGRVPTGESLESAIRRVDEISTGYPLYFMINCAHPSHFESVLAGSADWLGRIMGIRSNASKCSHAELDEAEQLDAGNPAELGTDYARLKRLLPELSVYGGCCGTDIRHVSQIANACL